MEFGEAIQTGFSRYLNFSDRAIRSEYWFWLLFVIIGVLMTRVIDIFIGFPLAYTIFFLATLLPSIAVAVRRLHDLDRTGWWLLLVNVPLIGGFAQIGFAQMMMRPTSGWGAGEFLVLGLLSLTWLLGSIILIVWFCRHGAVGENRFGPDPLAGVP